jgi:hypothetical protein
VHGRERRDLCELLETTTPLQAKDHAMIDEFIKQATSQLGISEQAAKGATGGLLGMVQQATGGGNDFNQLMQLLPGAQNLIGGGGAAPAGGSGGASGGGGLLGAAMGALGGAKSAGAGAGGGLLGAAASALGGKLPGGLGQAAGLLGMLSQNGIGADKAGGFVNLFMQFVQGKGGGQILQGLLGKMPELNALIK